MITTQLFQETLTGVYLPQENEPTHKREISCYKFVYWILKILNLVFYDK